MNVYRSLTTPYIYCYCIWGTHTLMMNYEEALDLLFRLVIYPQTEEYVRVSFANSVFIHRKTNETDAF